MVVPREMEWSGNEPLLRWQDRTVPLADLGRLVGLPGRDLAEGPAFHAVLIEQGRNLSGLAVDGLVGAYEAVIKPLGMPLKTIPGLAGATVMGDGKTVLVLDLKALV